MVNCEGHVEDVSFTLLTIKQRSNVGHAREDPFWPATRKFRKGHMNGVVCSTPKLSITDVLMILLILNKYKIKERTKPLRGRLVLRGPFQS